MSISRYYSPVTVAVSMASCFLLVSCGKSNTPATVVIAAPAPFVKTAVLSGTGGAAEIRLSAEVKPRFESRLAFRVPGRITERKVEVGQQVASGTLIARIDPTDYALASQAAQAGTAAAQADATLTGAELKRYQELADKGFISAAALEQRRAAAQASAAKLKQAQLSASTQSNQVNYANLVATESGIVIGVDADPGQVVSAGQTIVRIARGTASDAVVALPEQWLAAARVGQFKVTIPATGKTSDATVREIAAVADPATRTYAVKLGLPDAVVGEIAAAKFGMSAQVLLLVPALVGAGSGIQTVPLNAVVEQNGKSIVYVVDAKTLIVNAKPVEVLGSIAGTDVQVRGLGSAERIVVAGAHLLTQGQTVKVAP